MLQLIRRLLSLGRRLRSESGASAVEFAVAAPLLIGMLIPLVDLGMGLYEKMQVEDAAQAGAQYALLHASTYDSTAIQNAVTNATTLASVSASPAPTQTCGCPSGTAVVAATCGTTCTASGATAGTYVTVNAQVTYTPMISYPVLGSSVTLSAQSVVRTN